MVSSTGRSSDGPLSGDLGSERSIAGISSVFFPVFFLLAELGH
jgi:hypothetical protein